MARKQFLALVVALGGFAVQAAIPGIASADSGGGLLGGLTDTVTNVVDNTTGTVDNVLNDVTNTPEQDGQATEQEGLVPGLTNTVGDTLAPVTGSLNQTLEPLTKSTGETLAPVTKTVTDTLAPVTDTLAPVVEDVAPVLAPVVDATAPIVESVAPVLTPVTEATGDLLAPTLDALEPVLEPVLDAVQPVLEPVGEALEPVLQPVVDLAQPLVEPVLDLIEPITEPVGEILDPVVDPVLDIVDPVVDPIVDPVTPDPITDPDPTDTGNNPSTVTPFPGSGPFDGGSTVLVDATGSLAGDLPAGSVPSFTGGDVFLGGAEGGVPVHTGGVDLRPEAFRDRWLVSPAGELIGGPVGVYALPNGQPVLVGPNTPAASPAAPQAPIELPAGSPVSQVSIVSGSGSSNNLPRFEWPSASLPLGLLGLFALGALLVLAVTEASPRTWQFRPYTPPA